MPHSSTGDPHSLPPPPPLVKVTKWGHGCVWTAPCGTAEECGNATVALVRLQSSGPRNALAECSRWVGQREAEALPLMMGGAGQDSPMINPETEASHGPVGDSGRCRL